MKWKRHTDMVRFKRIRQITHVQTLGIWKKCFWSVSQEIQRIVIKGQIHIKVFNVELLNVKSTTKKIRVRVPK